MLPGKSLFSPPKPPAPVIYQPPPAQVAAATPPERTDPKIAEAADKARQDELKRRGRAASILTSGQGVTEDAPLGRPAATLGG